VLRGRPDGQRLTANLIALACQHGDYGYRKIVGLNPCRRKRYCGVKSASDA
jgi:hypothetical protein